MLEKAKTQLEILERMGLEVYIAGGFVRDILNGIEPKDIDIFVIGSDGSKCATTVATINDQYQESGCSWYTNYGNSVVREEVQSIFKVGEELDIVFMQPSYYHQIGFLNFVVKNYEITDAVLDFDVSICGCYAELNEEGDLDIFVTEDYMDWVDKGVIYRYTNIPTTDGHLQRVADKFKTPLTMKEVDRDMSFIKYKTI